MTETTDTQLENIIDGTDMETEHAEDKHECCCSDTDAKHMTDDTDAHAEEATVEHVGDCGCCDVHEQTTPEFDGTQKHDEADSCPCRVDDSDKSAADTVKEKATEAFEAAGDAVTKAGESIAAAAHAAADEFDADEAKEAAKSIVHGAATVGKSFAGVARRFVTTLVSHDEKSDSDDGNVIIE